MVLVYSTHRTLSWTFTRCLLLYAERICTDTSYNEVHVSHAVQCGDGFAVL